jgi:hypothetical protein
VRSWLLWLLPLPLTLLRHRCQQQHSLAAVRPLLLLVVVVVVVHLLLMLALRAESARM